MKIKCLQCNKEVEATLVTGDIVYPHRKDLKNKNFYKCPLCGSYVGCHQGTKKPLGCIPSTALRRARMKVHDKLDRFWKSGKYKRSFVYKFISEKVGYTYHTGNTKTIEECNKVLTILTQLEDKESKK